MADEKVTLWDSFKNNLALFSTLLLLLGIVRTISYYSYYDIDIISYIDLSEALTLSTSDFLFTGLMLAIGLVSNWFLTTDREVQLYQVDHQENINQSFSIRLKRHIQLAGGKNVAVILPMTVFYILALLGVIDNVNAEAFQIQYLVMFWMINSRLLFTEIDIEYYRKYGKEIPPRVYNFLTLGSMVFIIVCMSARTRAIYNLEQPRQSARMLFNGKVVRSTSDLVYVGKTKGTVFFFSKRRNGYYAYPTSEIKLFALDKDNHLSSK